MPYIIPNDAIAAMRQADLTVDGVSIVSKSAFPSRETLLHGHVCAANSGTW